VSTSVNLRIKQGCSEKYYTTVGHMRLSAVFRSVYFLSKIKYNLFF
jgi:hypothetical protein